MPTGRQVCVLSRRDGFPLTHRNTNPPYYSTEVRTYYEPMKYELAYRQAGFAVRKFVSLSYFVGIIKECQLIPARNIIIINQFPYHKNAKDNTGNAVQSGKCPVYTAQIGRFYNQMLVKKNSDKNNSTYPIE